MMKSKRISRSGEGRSPPGTPWGGDPGDLPTRIVRPSTGWAPLDILQLWRHRELVFFLAWRDVQLRYRQTLLGVGWAVLQPVLATVVFAVFFGRLGGLPSDGLPYGLFALAGLIPWQMFSYVLLQSGNSLIENQNILRKVYFPRIIVPAASIGAGILDFTVSFAVLLLAMGWYRVGISWRLLALPPLIVLALVTALGVGLWMATLNVRFRDVRHTLPFVSQLWFFVTPVVYPVSMVPDRYRDLMGLNPMAGVVEGFRWALLGAGQVSAGLLAISTMVAGAMLVSGIVYFRRMERGFADVL
jgi:lipopolysaccharide transport system permease protein